MKMDVHNKIIAIGASTGGLRALKQILPDLPADLRAAVFVVLHIGAGESILPRVLGAHCKLPVLHATDGAPIESGKVYVAPPDHHMLLEADRMRLTRSAKENHARPAIDPLLRSAAVAYRQRVIGVVLTGNLDDGTVGLQAVKAYGGTAIVQSPDEAEARSMPLSASRYVDTDYCLPLAEIAPTLAMLARREGDAVKFMNNHRVINMENSVALTGDLSEEKIDAIASRSTQTCPDCGGTLWTINGSNPVRFRCHTGHAYTAQSMLAHQNDFAEQAVWAAVRALHERHTLLKRLAEGAKEHGYDKQAEEYEASAETAADHAKALRKMITS
jgi:two-component system chemotaxis response regulator CheB